MNAIELLKEDHRKVKKLLDEVASTTEKGVKTREDLYRRIKQEMEIHEALEEEIFYPALKEHSEAREVVLEGYEEHDVVDRLLGELGELDVGDETWGPKAKVMKENVEHHIEEEEEEMFEKAQDIFDPETLEALGRRMADRKAQLAS